MQYYRERLHPSALTMLPCVLVIPASLLVFAPINMTAGVVTGLVLLAGAVGALVLGAPVITVDSDEFRAGRAHIPVSLLGSAEVFRGQEARNQRGTGLDARAWLCIRGWIDPVVRIDIIDAEDPTPYWLVSSRKPELLVAALLRARTESERL